MRIFLTGATGYVGAAVLDALVRGGHDVTALVRNNEKARDVARRGGHPVIGSLADLESFRGSAEAQDGYVHAAFDSSAGGGPAVEVIGPSHGAKKSARRIDRSIVKASGVM